MRRPLWDLSLGKQGGSKWREMYPVRGYAAPTNGAERRHARLSGPIETEATYPSAPAHRGALHSTVDPVMGPVDPALTTSDSDRAAFVAALRKAFKFWCDAEADGLMRRPAPHHGQAGRVFRAHTCAENI
jgi:hypothetical protein